MTDFSITLPKGNNIHKPNISKDLRVNPDIKLALSAFNTDGNENLSSDELLQAFDYFTNKEKEIAAAGKKGDGVITSKDIEQIVKTDSRFNAIREKYNDDNKVVNLLTKTVLTLSALVQDNSISAENIEPSYIKGTGNGKLYVSFPEDTVKNVQSEIKEIDGKKVKICKNNKGETYVMTESGKHIYTNPEYVAKCLGYETESTWFGLGANKYYETGSNTSFQQVGNGGHTVSQQVKNYKVWNEDTHSFTNGESKYSNRKTHQISCR